MIVFISRLRRELCEFAVIYKEKEEGHIMKIFISADIEGTTGCTDWRETELGSELYTRQQKIMQQEVAAACRGAVKGGATEIYIKDAHDSALNLSFEGLPREAHLIRGWCSSPDTMVAGVDESFAGAAFVGYHSPAGSCASPLAHTSSYSKIYSLRINGELCAEYDLYDMACAQYGVPVLFLSGDENICRLAESRTQGIVTVATKYGVAGGTVNKHPDVVAEEIEERMALAVAQRLARPRVQPEELVMDVTFKGHERARRGAWYPGAERLDDYTVRYVAKNFHDLLVAYMFIED